MSATVIVTPGARYPFTPSCSCGQLFRGYVAEHAAQLMADAHVCPAIEAALSAPLGSTVSGRNGVLVKAFASWSPATAERARLVADPAVDYPAWRAAIGRHDEAMLTSDGRTVTRASWCTCGGEDVVRYEMWSEAGRTAHGYACTSCRAVVQTG